MANIIITHFSGIFLGGEFKSSCYYDGLIQALTNLGHNVLQLITSDFLERPWGGSNEPTSQKIKNQLQEKVKHFNPDLIISFNNSSISGIEDWISCPIAVWDADAFQFFNDKDTLIKKADRYHFMAFSNAGLEDYKKQLTIHESRMCRVPSATSVVPKKIEKKYDISFIGSPFFNSSNLLQLLKVYPELMQLSPETLQKTDIKLKRMLAEHGVKVSELQHFRSGDRRASLILSLLDFDMGVFGPKQWLELASHGTKIIQAYDPRAVYSLEHNQKIYNRSKLSLNISHTQNITGYPWRVLDILASSSVLLTDYKSDLKNDFLGKIEFQFYDSPHEAYSKASQLIKDEKRREDLVAQQNEAIEVGFRWHHRFPLIQQLTGVNLEKANPPSLGKYERFRLEESYLHRWAYESSLRLKKINNKKNSEINVSPEKKYREVVPIRKRCKRGVVLILKYFFPKAIYTGLLKALHAKNDLNAEYK